jgi:stress-induced-phosphoprotein 1
MSNKALAQTKKNEGNTFFKNKNYREAIAKYTEAIAADNTDVTFFSNRSACYAALNEWQLAAEDGKSCIVTDRNFVKGYFRLGLALQNLQDFEGASDAVKRGLGIESTNADLKRMSRELDESMRMKRVEAAIQLAETQLSSQDIQGAYKTCDNALRLDPTNENLNRQMGRIRPLYERAEKNRVAGLDKKERLKEEGDQKFKSADFEGAIAAYTMALDAIPDKSAEIALKCYNNLAACYKQLSNFEGTIADSTHVLEYKPDDIKALMRRAQAFEACERYKSALQDVRQVLAYGIDTCGKPTFDLANGMQHRLNRVIAQHRQMS